MKLRQSLRSKAKIKMALQGPSGSGKSLSSLLLARGLAKGDLTKVAVIDTENGSADLYAHIGSYNVLPLSPPYSPERYIEAIDVCLTSGIEVIIIDSISHCWDFLIDYHAALPGNSFTNWSKITPRQKAFVDKILQSQAHFICTMRVKQDYVLSERNGKMVPEKVGLKAIQRDEISYEFTIVFDLDIKHFAIASKDRTNLFEGKPQFVINDSTGRKISEWCNGTVNVEQLKHMVTECNNMAELTALYNNHFELAKTIEQEFIAKKNLLEQLNNLNNKSNGNGTYSGK